MEHGIELKQLPTGLALSVRGTYKAMIWMESVGITHAPLTPGKHNLGLHVVNTEPAFGGFSEYNNTWIVRVAP